jgi:uncharacterized protein YggU (UPF0235/DUF167 family)
MRGMSDIFRQKFISGQRRFFIKLTPKASASRIGDFAAGRDGMEVLKIYVTAAPEKNKANAAMIEIVAEYLGISKSSIILEKGDTSRDKIIFISSPLPADRNKS